MKCKHRWHFYKNTNVIFFHFICDKCGATKTIKQGLEKLDISKENKEAKR